MTTVTRGRREILPDYPDTGCPGGCDVSLACPFPICVYDRPGWLRRQRQAVRDRQIVHRRGQGQSAEEVAAAFDVSKRTVSRVMHEHRKRAT